MPLSFGLSYLYSLFGFINRKFSNITKCQVAYQLKKKWFKPNRISKGKKKFKMYLLTYQFKTKGQQKVPLQSHQIFKLKLLWKYCTYSFIRLSKYGPILFLFFEQIHFGRVIHAKDNVSVETPAFMPLFMGCHVILVNVCLG